MVVRCMCICRSYFPVLIFSILSLVVIAYMSEQIGISWARYLPLLVAAADPPFGVIIALRKE